MSVLRKAAPYLAGVAGFNALPAIANETRGGYGAVDPVEVGSQHTAATLLGLLAGSKKVRSGVGNYLTPLRAVGEQQTVRSLSPMRALNVAGLPAAATLALPWAAGQGVKARDGIDALGDQVGNVIAEAAQSGKGTVDFMAERAAKAVSQTDIARELPDRVQAGVADAAMRGGEAVAPWINGQAKQVATQMGLAIPGTVAGWAAGNAAFPDDETMDYDTRRSQERKRNIARFIASAGLGAGGMAIGNHFMNKSAFAQQDIDRLVPDDPNQLSELFLMPGAQRRAGRARGLAEAFGNQVPFGVDLPRTQRTLLAGAGGIAGGLAGSYVGDKATGTPEGRIGGGAAGSVAGGAIGMLLDAVLRQRQTKRVKEDATADLSRGERPTSAIGKGNPFAALRSGVHQQGRADVAENVAFGRKHFDGNPVMTGLELGNMVPGLSAVTGAPSLVGSLINYGGARERIDGSRPIPTRQVA